MREGKNICDVLRKHLGQRTVLGVALPVLAGHIAALKKGALFLGLRERQIEKGFNDLADQFVHSEYHSTYLDRRVGARGFLQIANGKYRIRKKLLSGVTIIALEQLHTELVTSLQSVYERRKAVIKELEAACSLPPARIEDRRALVNAYLSQLSGNRGEMFEVISFAVLREYFRLFGFSLQRFSTTHANDGGMDFVAGEAIYQVTTDESAQKIRRDLGKAPGTKRVLVRPTIPADLRSFHSNDVLETIELKDLLNHFVSWLLARDMQTKKARHLQQVLRTALNEFRRENRAQTATLVT